jgi:hypothetical protein
MVPQSRSTDPRLGRVTLKAATLYDRMWINADDQGRLSGDPDEIKYTACPNLSDIARDDIPLLLERLKAQGLIKVYSSSRHTAIQMIDWWKEQKLQWAYPSQYPPPEGWTDHLRYHPTPTEIITENWPPSRLPSQLPSNSSNSPALPSELGSSQTHEGRAGKKFKSRGLPGPLAKELPQREKEPKREKEIERKEEEIKRRLPSGLGKTPTTSENEFLKFLFGLENWRFDKDDDLVWLREFSAEFGEFTLAVAKATRDYHSGRGPPKHKGHWKNRFRQWMIHERQFAKERGETGEQQPEKGVRPRPQQERVHLIRRITGDEETED